MNDHALSTYIGFGKFDPVMIAPDQDDRVTACLRGLSGHSHAEEFMAETAIMAQDDFWPAQGDWRASYRPYVVKAGILHVPVKGVLLHDMPYSIGSYATGYYYIQKAIERGVQDPEVKGIALVCDSPGGHVAGCFELVDRIYQMRSEKPIQAFAHESAYSAAYAIASAASKLTVSKTGGVGSIGVVTMHVDYSGQMDKMGVKVTFIFAGSHKVDGNPYEALPKAVKDRIQSRIDQSYAVFVQAVARNRGMKESAVRATEALTFTASEAVDQKLADKIGPLDTALADFAAYLCGETDGEDDMAEKQEPTAAEIALREQAAKDQTAQAVAAAATAERARISGIKSCANAKGRSAAAESLAMNTDMSVEAANTLLGTFPKEAAAAAPATTETETNVGSKGFDAVMTQQGVSGVKAGDDKAGPTDEKSKAAATSSRILGAYFGTEKK